MNHLYAILSAFLAVTLLMAASYTGFIIGRDNGADVTMEAIYNMCVFG